MLRFAALQEAPGSPPAWLLLGAALGGLALAAALAVALMRTARRGLFASSREIVRAAEEIAEGRLDRAATLAPDDPLAPAAAALGRLAAALRSRSGETERRLKTMEEIVGASREVALLLTDAAGEIRYASPAAAALFGWKSGEASGRNLAEIFEPEDYDALLPRLSRRSLREGPLLERALLAGRQRRFPASVSVSSFRALPGGGGEGLLFEIRDLSAQESGHDEVVESEKTLRALVQRLPLGILVVQKGKIVYANSVAASMIEMEEDPSGIDFRDLLASEDLLGVLDRVRRLEAGEEPDFEMDARLHPRATRWPVEVVLAASRIAFREAPATIVTVRRHGADRGTLRQALASEARLGAALEASDEAILLVGVAGRISLANRGFEGLFGLAPRSLAGLDVAGLGNILGPCFGEPDALRAFLEAATERAEEAAVILETTDSPARAISLSARDAHDKAGRRIGRLVEGRDVTAQREQERRLAREADELSRTRELLERANQELERLNTQITTRSAEAERKNLELRTLDEMKSNLLANVSHELQTPLVSIKGYTEMILKGKLGSVTEEQKKGLEVSLRNIDRLIAMINNLLSFSQLERDWAGLKITTFPLHQVIEEAIDLIREAAEERRILLTSRYLTDDLAVKADRDKISQVFINLLGNAVKYNRDGGQVEVDVRKGKQGFLIVDVRDTGIGIPRESLEKVFERHFRARSEGETIAGSGIGLAIVRDILRMHGCVIKADSRMGEGSVFTLTLPLATSSDETRGRGASPQLPGSPGSSEDPLRSSRRPI